MKVKLNFLYYTLEHFTRAESSHRLKRVHRQRVKNWRDKSSRANAMLGVNGGLICASSGGTYIAQLREMANEDELPRQRLGGTRPLAELNFPRCGRKMEKNRAKVAHSRICPKSRVYIINLDIFLHPRRGLARGVSHSSLVTACQQSPLCSFATILFPLDLWYSLRRILRM